MSVVENDIDRIYDMLKEVSGDLKEHNKILTEVQINIAQLQVKSSLWGFAGGLFAILIVWAKSIVSSYIH